MTAHEVIDQIRALPPEERAKVIDFVDAVKAAQQGGTEEKSFAEAMNWTFNEHAELMRKLSQ